MTLSVVEKANAFSAGDNGGSREDKYGSSKGTKAGARTGCRGSSQIGPLCNRSRQGEELLYLWGIWAHGPPLQKQRKRKGYEGKESRVQERKDRGN